MRKKLEEIIDHCRECPYCLEGEDTIKCQHPQIKGWDPLIFCKWIDKEEDWGPFPYWCPLDSVDANLANPMEEENERILELWQVDYCQMAEDGHHDGIPCMFCGQRPEGD